MSVKVELTNNTPDVRYRLTFESPRFEDIEDLIERVWVNGDSLPLPPME